MKAHTLIRVKTLSGGKVFEAEASARAAKMPDDCVGDYPVTITDDDIATGMVTGTYFDVVGEGRVLVEMTRRIADVTPGERWIVDLGGTWWPCEVRPGEVPVAGCVVEMNEATYKAVVGKDVHLQDVTCPALPPNAALTTVVSAKVGALLQIDDGAWMSCYAAITDGRPIFVPGVTLQCDGNTLSTPPLADPSVLSRVPPRVLDFIQRELADKLGLTSKAERPELVRTWVDGYLFCAMPLDASAPQVAPPEGDTWQAVARADGGWLLISSTPTAPDLGVPWLVKKRAAVTGRFIETDDDRSVAVHAVLPDGKYCLSLLL